LGQWPGGTRFDAEGTRDQVKRIPLKTNARKTLREPARKCATCRPQSVWSNLLRARVERPPIGLLTTHRGDLDHGPGLGHLFLMTSVAEGLKTTIATALRDQMQAEKISVSAMAKRIRTSRNAVRRLLDGKNTAVTLVSMVKAAEAANLELTISAKPRPLDELRPLAERLAQARNPAEAARLKRQLIKGYYGSRVRRAAHA
jgi:hypothetical protein